MHTTCGGKSALQPAANTGNLIATSTPRLPSAGVPDNTTIAKLSGWLPAVSTLSQRDTNRTDSSLLSPTFSTHTVMGALSLTDMKPLRQGE